MCKNVIFLFLESPSNATTRQLGMFGFPSPYTPPYGGFHPGGFNSHQPYPSYGGYDGYKPNLTPMGPYQGVPSPMYQQPGFGAALYPGSSPYGQYPPNGLYGAAAAQGPYYPSNPTSSPYPANSFNPSYGTYPSNNVYYNPSTSAVTSQNSYRPSGLIPDPFSSVAPIIGTSSYSPASNTGSSYNPSQISPQYNQQQYKPITIIDTPSYSPSSYLQGSNSYKPSISSGSQEGYDSVVVTAQGMGAYDQPSSYKPSSGNYQPTVSSQTNYNKPQSPSYRPPSNSYSQQNSYRPITVQGSIQEIPNTPAYYPSHSQNRPSFYSASSSDKVTFPNE